jgi:hypothetical protein
LIKSCIGYSFDSVVGVRRRRPLVPVVRGAIDAGAMPSSFAVRPLPRGDAGLVDDAHLDLGERHAERKVMRSPTQPGEGHESARQGIFIDHE